MNIAMLSPRSGQQSATPTHMVTLGKLESVSQHWSNTAHRCRSRASQTRYWRHCDICRAHSRVDHRDFVTLRPSDQRIRDASLRMVWADGLPKSADLFGDLVQNPGTKKPLSCRSDVRCDRSSYCCPASQPRNGRDCSKCISRPIALILGLVCCSVRSRSRLPRLESLFCRISLAQIGWRRAA
jgi:hypothetical protein